MLNTYISKYIQRINESKESSLLVGRHLFRWFRLFFLFTLYLLLFVFSFFLDYWQLLLIAAVVVIELDLPYLFSEGLDVSLGDRGQNLLE